jgi:hypothetical protein
MTPEQEQIVLDMLCSFADIAMVLEENVHSSDKYKHVVTCPYCGASTREYQLDELHMRHKQTCIVEQAIRLRGTRKTE